MRISLKLSICLINLAHAWISPQDEIQMVQVSTNVQQAPQVQPVQVGNPLNLASFHSNDGNACFEGPADLAEAALATKRVAPYGALINASYIKNGVRCADEGYHLTVGEDDCYPGLNVFKKFELGFLSYRVSKRFTLDAYGKRYGLNNSLVERMVACTCHGNSHLRSLHKGNCSSLESLPGSWVYRDPRKNNEFTCEEGRFESSTRAAAMLKSGGQVHPVKCKILGFPEPTKAKEVSVSFLSNDGHVCFEGFSDIAEHALSLKKSSPYSSVFNGSSLRTKRCEDDGFKFTVGKDDCYPGVHVYTKAQHLMMLYKLHKHNVLTAYSKHYKLPYSKLELMNACICHPKSNLRAQFDHQCGSLDLVNVSWVRNNQQSGSLICEQGPFESTTRAAVLLKNTGQVPVPPDYLNDHFAPIPCSNHLSEQQH